MEPGKVDQAPAGHEKRGQSQQEKCHEASPVSPGNLGSLRESSYGLRYWWKRKRGGR